METWKYIDNEKLYMVSTFGRVKSTGNLYTYYNKFGTKIQHHNRNKLLKFSDNGHGYLRTVLGRKNYQYVHRLVGLVFIKGQTKTKKYINHKNGIKSDNRAENLEWVTASENQQHSKDIGLCKLGEDHPNAKLSNKQVKFIKEHYKPFDINFGAKPLSEKLGVTKSIIGRIANGTRRIHG